MTRDSESDDLPRWMRWLLMGVSGLALFAAAPAQAGVPECGNLRLEDVGNCELAGEVSCTAGCDNLGVYKKACATQLYTVCSEECTFTGDVTCTDECTGICTESCDRGENVICIHNCFGECTIDCDARCEGAEDDAQCHATCEANCDAECDITCKPLVDGDCYKHCVECCGGSCTASANLDCQTTCQDEEFESCEYELKADCHGSCEGEGALFCDGEYVLSGNEVDDCIAALVAIGLEDIEAEAEGRIDLDEGIAEGSASAGCSVGLGGSPAGGALMAGLGCLLLLRRRRRSAR